MGRARTALRAAVGCSPREPGAGGLDLQCGPVARDALGLLPGGGLPPGQ
jgi:hypothetical protein